VFELVLVVQHWIVELSVHPHSVDDFEPALGQATQGIGVTLTFIAMVAVVDFGPGAPGQGLLGKQVHGMAKVLAARNPKKAASLGIPTRYRLVAAINPASSLYPLLHFIQ
jgi:hypothetical protein